MQADAAAAAIDPCLGYVGIESEGKNNLEYSVYNVSSYWYWIV